MEKMMTRDIYAKLDKAIQDKFDGTAGNAAFREAAVITFLLLTHHAVKIPMTRQEAAEFDNLYYGSLAKTHPFHPVRVWVQEKTGDWAEHLDNLSGQHLQHKFAWFDKHMPQVHAYLQAKAAGRRW